MNKPISGQKYLKTADIKLKNLTFPNLGIKITVVNLDGKILAFYETTLAYIIGFIFIPFKNVPKKGR